MRLMKIKSFLAFTFGFSFLTFSMASDDLKELRVEMSPPLKHTLKMVPYKYDLHYDLVEKLDDELKKNKQVALDWKIINSNLFMEEEGYGGSKLTWVIYRQNHQESSAEKVKDFRGVIYLHIPEKDALSESGWMSIFILPAYQRQGIGSQATQRLIKHLLRPERVPPLDAFYVSIPSGNIASEKLVSHLAFHKKQEHIPVVRQVQDSNQTKDQSSVWEFTNPLLTKEKENESDEDETLVFYY